MLYTWRKHVLKSTEINESQWYTPVLLASRSVGWTKTVLPSYLLHQKTRCWQRWHVYWQSCSPRMKLLQRLQSMRLGRTEFSRDCSLLSEWIFQLRMSCQCLENAQLPFRKTINVSRWKRRGHDSEVALIRIGITLIFMVFDDYILMNPLWVHDDLLL
jgi:hypothetical protein